MMMIFTMVNDDGAPDVRLMPLSGSDLWEEDDGDDDGDDDDDDDDDGFEWLRSVEGEQCSKSVSLRPLFLPFTR